MNSLEKARRAREAREKQEEQEKQAKETKRWLRRYNARTRISGFFRAVFVDFPLLLAKPFRGKGSRRRGARPSIFGVLAVVAIIVPLVMTVLITVASQLKQLELLAKLIPIAKYILAGQVAVGLVCFFALLGSRDNRISVGAIAGIVGVALVLGLVLVGANGMLENAGLV